MPGIGGEKLKDVANVQQRLLVWFSEGNNKSQFPAFSLQDVPGLGPFLEKVVLKFHRCNKSSS